MKKLAFDRGHAGKCLMRVAALLPRAKFKCTQFILSFPQCAQQHWFSIGLAVIFLRASDLHLAAETSISGAVHRKLMFHAQFSGITGELYAVGQIRLFSAGEIFLTATILASEKGRLCGPLNPADRNGGCVPSFLWAEERSGREVRWLPKAGDAASQRSYSSSRAARSAFPLPPAASGLPSEKMLQ